MTAANARVCMVSLRGSNKHVAWCTNYEFEDVVCSIDDVELFNLVPGRAYNAQAMDRAPPSVATGRATADTAH